MDNEEYRARRDVAKAGSEIGTGICLGLWGLGVCIIIAAYIH